MDGSATSADPSTARALANGIETPSHLAWLVVVLAMFAANDEQRSVERVELIFYILPVTVSCVGSPCVHVRFWAFVRKPKMGRSRFS